MEAPTARAPTVVDTLVRRSTCGNRSPLRVLTAEALTEADARPQVMAADILLPALAAAMQRQAATEVADPPTVAEVDRTVAAVAAADTGADGDIDIDIALGVFPA